MSVEQSFTEARKAHYERAKRIKVNAIVELAETMEIEELGSIVGRLRQMFYDKVNQHVNETAGTGNE